MSAGQQRRQPAFFLRNIDPKLWRELRGECIKRGYTVTEKIESLARAWLKTTGEAARTTSAADK